MSETETTDQPLPLVAHLTELRDRLLRALLAVLVVAIGLMPMTLAVIKSDRVSVHSLYGAQFPGIPQIKDKSQITLLEEEKLRTAASRRVDDAGAFV